MHAAQLGLLVGLAGRPASLVVDHDQLTVRPEVEPVDDAPQSERAQVGFEHELQADGADLVRVLQFEIVADKLGGIGDEGRPGVFVELESGVLWPGHDLRTCEVQLGDSSVDGAFADNHMGEEALERTMHKRPFDRPYGGWFR